MGTGAVPHGIDGGDRLRGAAGQGVRRRRPVRHGGHRGRCAADRRRRVPGQRGPQVGQVRSGPLGLAVLVLTGLACGAAGSEEPYVPPVIPPGTPVVLVGAGDIADCSNDNDEATARLLDSLVQDTLPVIVFTAGDNAYSDGTASQFANCYHPTWGRHKARTRPAPGNHDYRTSGASGYFGYFGGAAGDPSRGYYSFDAGDAHVIVLNSEPDMDAGSAQEQ